LKLSAEDLFFGGATLLFQFFLWNLFWRHNFIFKSS